MTNDNNEHKGVFSPEDVSKRTLEVIEERVKDPRGGIELGIPMIDKVLLPMRPGEVIGVLGYTSNYKSGLMNFVARYHARKLQEEGSKKAVVSVLWEQSIEEQGAVDIAQLIRIDATKMMRGELSISELKELKRGAEERGKIPWYLIGHSVLDKTKRSRMDMDGVARAFDRLEKVLEVEPALVTLDYLQRIGRGKKANTMREGFIEIVDRVKDLSLAVGVPVMLGCQAKRDVKRRKWKMPQQDDAQETSNFEQTCDKLISLWMPKNDYPVDQIDKRGGEGNELKWVVANDLLLLLIAKQRFGPAPCLFQCKVKPEFGEIFAVDPHIESN